MKKQHEKFMREAIRVSLENVKLKNGGPFGAVIVQDGKIIAEGSNLVTSTNDPTAHAEVVAIRRACEKLEDFNLDDCIIYTSCEPCPMCLSAIYWARIKKVVFANTRQDAAKIGFDDNLIYEEIPKALEDRILPIKQILQEEAQVAFKQWAEDEDKITY